MEWAGGSPEEKRADLQSGGMALLHPHPGSETLPQCCSQSLQAFPLWASFLYLVPPEALCFPKEQQPFISGTRALGGFPPWFPPPAPQPPAQLSPLGLARKAESPAPWWRPRARSSERPGFSSHPPDPGLTTTIPHFVVLGCPLGHKS